jgi:hypothetical protein
MGFPLFSPLSSLLKIRTMDKVQKAISFIQQPSSEPFRIYLNFESLWLFYFYKNTGRILHICRKHLLLAELTIIHCLNVAFDCEFSPQSLFNTNMDGTSSSNGLLHIWEMLRSNIDFDTSYKCFLMIISLCRQCWESTSLKPRPLASSLFQYLIRQSVIFDVVESKTFSVVK